ncbi:MAG: sugar transferase [Nitrospirae bacterium]|nr:sugar transferase [Nitrospirota bacterium]
MIKRLFDIFFSFSGLLIFSPLFVVVAVLIKIDSKGPVFFKQERIGKNFKSFNIYKFRTMKNNAEKHGPKITVRGDSRVTGIGRFLRKYKIDELPQLFNVLKGDMSFVGPRPEISEYVQLFKSDYKKLLGIRPGITDPASIKYSNEEAVLYSSGNWEEEYKTRILPEKIRLSLNYLKKRNILTDLKIILETVLRTPGTY